MANKRLNFSVIERDILLRLIEDNIEIIESKKNDGLTVKRKDEAWARIVSRYNAEYDVVKRTHRQLRKYWNNLKMRAKKSMSVNGYTTITLPSSNIVTPIRRSAKSTSGRANETFNGLARSTSTPVFPEPVIKEVPPLSCYHQQQHDEGEADQQQSSLVEAGIADEEEAMYSGRSNGEAMGEGDEDYADIVGSDAEDIGEEFHWVDDKGFRHETAERVITGNNVQYVRNEREAKMALLSIQMETAHEQRELARELREQTRQRHRLEMQLLEEKRRYRKMKMDALCLQGQSRDHRPNLGGGE